MVYLHNPRPFILLFFLFVCITLLIVLCVLTIPTHTISEPLSNEDVKLQTFEEELILGCIMKNTSDSFEYVSNWILNFKKYVPKLKLYIYENNSTDDTSQKIALFHNNNLDWTMCKSEMIDTSPEFFPVRQQEGVCRISVIAHARNQLVKMISLNTSTETESPIMFLDADFTKGPSLEPLLRILNKFKNMEVDAIMANGKTQSGNYYDIFALRAHQFSLLGPELVGEHFWKTYVTEKQFWVNKEPNILVPVFSAFAGLGIYKHACLPYLNYSELPTAALYDMYAYIVTTYPDHESVQLYRKKFPEKIVFIPNSGHQDPVCCEHITVHANLWKNGFGRLFIHSDLDFYW
jgi:hypothetical protein